jgi:hypothetical protein
MVSSWTTNGKATTAGSLLVFEDNVGEDRLSSQSTNKVNINCLYYKEAIAPNQKVLNNLKPSKEQLEKVLGRIMKEVNDLRLQIVSKKPFLALIVKAKASILILPKLKPKMCFFPSWWYWISWLDNYKPICKIMVLWGYPSLTPILKLAIKKAIQKSPNWKLSSNLFEDDSNDEKNQSVGFVSSHKRGTLLTSFHIHSFVVFHTDLQKNTIVTCILTSWNRILSNMQDGLFQLSMQLIQYRHVSSFSTIITNEFIGEEFCLSQIRQRNLM